MNTFILCRDIKIYTIFFSLNRGMEAVTRPVTYRKRIADDARSINHISGSAIVHPPVCSATFLVFCLTPKPLACDVIEGWRHMFVPYGVNNCILIN